MNFFRNRFIVVVVTLLLALMPLPLFAQPGPPPIPLTPSGDLNDWTLVAPPWKSIEDDPALNFTNLATAPSWGYQGTCLSIDTNVPAFLQLPVYEDDWTNIDLTNGSLEIWCQANWTSMADSGSGPDSWATVFDIGNYRHDASIGAWRWPLTRRAAIWFGWRNPAGAIRCFQRPSTSTPETGIRS